MNTTKQCRFCKEEILKDATVCKHCNKKQTVGIGTRIGQFFLFIIAIGVISSFMSSGKSDTATTPTAQTTPTKSVSQMLQTEVTQWKNEPLSADTLTSVDVIQLRALLYSNWANLISKGEQSTNPDDKKLAEQLKALVIKKQVADFPVIRKAYAKVLKGTLFDEQVDDVTTSGAGNTTLTFVGSPFVSNKFVSTVADASSNAVLLLRFKRTEYRWSSDYSNDYKYNAIDSVSDSALVTTDKISK